MVTVYLRVMGFLGVLWENLDTRWYTRKEIAEGAGVSKSPSLVAILNRLVDEGKLEENTRWAVDEALPRQYRVVLKQMSLPGMEE